MQAARFLVEDQAKRYLTYRERRPADENRAIAENNRLKVEITKLVVNLYVCFRIGSVCF